MTGFKAIYETIAAFRCNGLAGREEKANILGLRAHVPQAILFTVTDTMGSNQFKYDERTFKPHIGRYLTLAEAMEAMDISRNTLKAYLRVFGLSLTAFLRSTDSAATIGLTPPRDICAFLPNAEELKRLHSVGWTEHECESDDCLICLKALYALRPDLNPRCTIHHAAPADCSSPQRAQPNGLANSYGSKLRST